MERETAPCVKCGSHRVVGGHFAGTTFTFYQQETQRLSCGPPRLSAYHDPTLCLDCGLIWTDTNPEHAEVLLDEYGLDEVTARLGLPSRGGQQQEAH